MKLRKKFDILCIRGKRFLPLLLLFCIAVISAGCSKEQTKETISHQYTKTENAQQLFKLEKLHNGDAKFFNDKIITSVSNEFCIYDKNGSLLKKYPQIRVNWLSDIPEEGIVLYSNAERQVGVAKLNENGNLISNINILTSDSLKIDPSVVKVDDTYYFTVTEIEGTVNNSDKNAENGIYTVKLYSTKDIQSGQNIQYITDIIKCKNNIEDVDLIHMNNKLSLVYEKEEVDKGNSSIWITSSQELTGEGISKWNNEEQLLASDCDHEPANLSVNEDGTYTLYYSCDKENPGQSYMGASIYTANYDSDFQLIRKDITVPMENRIGNLLYDVQVTNDKTEYLFSQNYMTDCNLIVEEQKKE